MTRPSRILYELLFVVTSVSAIAPLFLVERPPIQDLPQHVATIRALIDYGDPELAFSEYFRVELGRTQYLAYYGAAWALGSIVGAFEANRILLSLAIVGLPYSIRYLLRRLGADERPALFAIPLTWNAHLILGFLNFVAALPLCFLGLGLAVRLREEDRLLPAVGLSLITLVAFYTHVVPFAFLGLGAAWVLVGGSAKATALRWLSLAPPALAALLWSFTSPAGEATRAAAQLDTEEAPRMGARFASVAQNLRSAPDWLTDVLTSEVDERAFVVWLALALSALALAPSPVSRRWGTRAALRASLRARVALLAPVALVLYFVAPVSYDWIWPINARFPLLTLLFVLPVLPSPPRPSMHAIYLALTITTVHVHQEVGAAFERFESEEVGPLAEAIDRIPPGSRVAGLIFDRGSREVKFSPFLHSVAWVQAARGGAVMFTFSDFPASPIRFREDRRPPPVRARWEWTPERTALAELEWYEYVLTRGGPGRIGRAPERWEPIHRGGEWRVYRQRGLTAR